MSSHTFPQGPYLTTTISRAQSIPPNTPSYQLTPLLPPQHFNRTTNLLVHDPRSSLRLGDVIAIEPGWRVSKHVRHVVSKIIAPFGDPVEARPPVPSFEERMGERERKRAEKDARREARRREGAVEGRGQEKKLGNKGEDYNEATGEASERETA